MVSGEKWLPPEERQEPKGGEQGSDPFYSPCQHLLPHWPEKRAQEKKKEKGADGQATLCARRAGCCWRGKRPA